MEADKRALFDAFAHMQQKTREQGSALHSHRTGVVRAATTTPVTIKHRASVKHRASAPKFERNDDSGGGSDCRAATHAFYKGQSDKGQIRLHAGQ